MKELERALFWRQKDCSCGKWTGTIMTRCILKRGLAERDRRRSHKTVLTSAGYLLRVSGKFMQHKLTNDWTYKKGANNDQNE